MKRFTKAHRRALEEFADLRISLEELRPRLAGVVEFDFQNHERRLDSHYGTPVPGVRIGLKHIRAAMEKQARGKVSTEQLSDWASLADLQCSSVFAPFTTTAKEEILSPFPLCCADPALASCMVNLEKPHPGVAGKNPALHQGGLARL